MYFARAIGRLPKPPLTTLLPLSCATVANRWHNCPPPESSGDRPIKVAEVPNKTLASSDSKFSSHHERIEIEAGYDNLQLMRF